MTGIEVCVCSAPCFLSSFLSFSCISFLSFLSFISGFFGGDTISAFMVPMLQTNDCSHEPVAFNWVSPTTKALRSQVYEFPATFCSYLRLLQRWERWPGQLVRSTPCDKQKMLWGSIITCRYRLSGEKIWKSWDPNNTTSLGVHLQPASIPLAGKFKLMNFIYQATFRILCP